MRVLLSYIVSTVFTGNQLRARQRSLPRYVRFMTQLGSDVTPWLVCAKLSGTQGLQLSKLKDKTKN